MTWVESELGAFRARHNAEDARDARRVLQSLSVTELRMGDMFPQHLTEITVVLHSSNASLALAHPVLPLVWLSTAPAARRYVAGWAGRTELHVLSPKVLRGRASNVTGSREMLALSAAALYARRMVIAKNRDLQHVFWPVRVRREMRWAWLVEGAARGFSGQTDHARPASARRLREGGRPSFPPSYRDATLLGGSGFDLLAAERGERAAARLASRLDPGGPRAALIEAFGGRAIDHTEGAWRSHLARMAGAA